MGELDPPRAADFEFELLTGADRALTVRMRGELDLNRVDELDAAVAPLIEQGVDQLVLDAAALRFADSSAIALWVKWAAAVARLELHEPSALLRRVIQSMGLAELLYLEP